MGVASRLRSEGLRILKDRIVFTRDCHFLSNSASAVNFTGDKSLVVQQSMVLSGDLTITSPSKLSQLGLSSGQDIVQTVRIDDTGVPSQTPFRAAASGRITKMSAVYYQTEAGPLTSMAIYLSDGKGALSEDFIQFGPSAFAPGDVAVKVLSYVQSLKPNTYALGNVAQGDVRYLAVLPLGTASGNDCTVTIQIDPAFDA